ncbi:MAG TPA: epimerase [Pseudonocardiaceae bacterium]|nr:epimerase [Pseudonocardiaceae bacterium]
MKAVIFGATGMVGQGVLRECLRDERIDEVVAVGRTAVRGDHPKLRDVVADLWHLDPAEFTDADACLFCLGVSSAGMSEQDYRRITHDLTMAVAEVFPAGTTFCYVSGAGTDSSERGRIRWARIKGRTENALLAKPFPAYMFRPGIVQPMHGVVSKTPLYRTVYRFTGPLLSGLRRLFPRLVTSSEDLGRAMVRVAIDGWPQHILETRDINEAAAGPAGRSARPDPA